MSETLDPQAIEAIRARTAKFRREKRRGFPPNVELLTDAESLLRHIAAVEQEIEDEGLIPKSAHDVALASVRAERDTLAAEVQRLRAAQAWQPIETAPQDGTVVMLFRDMPPWSVRGFGYYWRQSNSLQGWVARGFDDPPGELGLAAPTHWQPLPAPPLPRATAEKGRPDDE